MYVFFGRALLKNTCVSMCPRAFINRWELEVYSKTTMYSPLVAAVDRMAAKSSLQGELRWEFCVPITVPSGDGLLQLPLTFWIPAPAKLMAAAAALFTATAALFMELDPVMLPPGPDPLVECGKYPPGEGRPSGPRPGLRLRSNVGGLHLCKKK